MELILKKDKTDIWMALYIGDYMADTIGLSLAEHGAYLLTIMAYWRKGGALSPEECRRASMGKFDSIKNFFRFDGGLWQHHGINRRLAEAEKMKQSQRDRTSSATEARWKRNGVRNGVRNGSRDESVTTTSSSSSSSSDLKKNTLSPPSRGVADEIFEFWQAELNHPKSILDKKRRAAINARIKEGLSVERIMDAIRGIKNSPFNMGQNDRNTAFDDIELICRSGANVDKFADMCGGKQEMIPGIWEVDEEEMYESN